MPPCDFCGVEIRGLPFRCSYCGGTFCGQHRIPENHGCRGMARGGVRRAFPPEPRGGRSRFQFRTESRGSRPVQSGPAVRGSRVRVVTASLAVANIVAFVLFYLAFPEYTIALAQVNSLVLGGEVWRLVTSVFVHFGAVHLLSNLFGLVIFGIRAEDEFGRAKVLLIYLGSGLFANLASLFLIAPDVASGGASGCIFGLMGAYYSSMGRRDRRMLKQGVLGTILYAAFTALQPGVNYWAHLFGALAGVLMGLAWSKRRV
ncbi:MAG: rhomboid family intramembrane serine protease [Promethearchaeota archaeon]